MIIDKSVIRSLDEILEILNTTYANEGNIPVVLNHEDIPTDENGMVLEKVICLDFLFGKEMDWNYYKSHIQKNQEG